MIVQKRIRLLLPLTLAFIACHQNPKNEINPAITNKTETAKRKYTQAMVDNKKDPSCGMPVSAGIEDTAHYSGKIYGFCSSECKQQFLKNPAELAKNAELK